MQNNHSLPKPKILYVEDHIESANLIATILKKLYEVILSQTPQQALDILNSNKIDLILMDIALQEKYDGLELIKQLKLNNKFKNIPIITLTAYAMHGDKEMLITGGADDYIAKPFNKTVLIEKINYLLQSSGLRNS